MSFESGSRLGPYEIVAPIGAGGMGEVYRARDTRLDRTVAVKVLSRALAADSESRRRFEEEARAIAALNDPHICTIHDVGRHAPRTLRNPRADRRRRHGRGLQSAGHAARAHVAVKVSPSTVSCRFMSTGSTSCAIVRAMAPNET